MGWLRRLFRRKPQWMPLDEAVREIMKQRNCTKEEALQVLFAVAGPDKVRVAPGSETAT
jgi:hypothetical protein